MHRIDPFLNSWCVNKLCSQAVSKVCNFGALVKDHVRVDCESDEIAKGGRGPSNEVRSKLVELVFDNLVPLTESLYSSVDLFACQFIFEIERVELLHKDVIEVVQCPVIVVRLPWVCWIVAVPLGEHDCNGA